MRHHQSEAERETPRDGKNNARPSTDKDKGTLAQENTEPSDSAKGYSQDSGYPQSGGYEPKDEERGTRFQHSGSPRGSAEEGEQGQIGIHADDSLDAAPYTPAHEDNADGTPSDESIRAALHDLLAGRAAPRGVLVTVHNGDVTLEGEVADAAEQEELGQLVRNTRGVRSVSNSLLARRF
jgi:hypothetical protein